MTEKPRPAATPRASAAVPVPRLREASGQHRQRRDLGWVWLAVVGLVLLLVGGTAVKLIFQRIATIDAALTTMATNHLLSDASRVTQRLGFLATQAEDAAARSAMGQDIEALLAMVRRNHPSVLPGYDPAGPELDALRALLPSAMSELQRLVAQPEAKAMLIGRVASLEREIEALQRSGAETAARRSVRLTETAYIHILIRVLLVTLILALAVFIALMFLSRARLRAANDELSEWAEDTAHLLAAIPGVLVRARKGPDGVWRRSFVGDAVTELTGHSVAEALTYGWLRSNIEPGEIAPLFQAFDEALAGIPRSATVRFRRKDGRIIHVRLLMSRHTQSNGEPELLCLWSDITREHERSEHLAHAAKLAHMGELMSGMAHELNQPLTSITLAAENAARLAGRSPLDGERINAKLDIVVAMATRASVLVERMRGYVRQGEDPKLPVHLRDLVGAARSVLENRLTLQGVSITTELPEDLPDILGSAMPLEQVLTQLMSNACDAYAAMSPAPGSRPIIISARALGPMLELTVQDQAGGIPPELLQRIFEPFFTTKPVGEGTGLGLSSSLAIVQQMGGSLTADNHGGGARFTLLLPVA